jgi:hypothetical protein
MRYVPGNLVAIYEGQSAKRTKRAFTSSKGGVLFLDEAYSLKACGQYANQAAGMILTETDKPSFDAGIMLVAGYQGSMKEGFDDVNQGFDRRFKKIVTFEDFNTDELIEVFQLSLKKQCDSGRIRVLENGFLPALRQRLVSDEGRWSKINGAFGNGLLEKLNSVLDRRTADEEAPGNVFSLVDLKVAYDEYRKDLPPLDQVSEQVLADINERKLDCFVAADGKARRVATGNLKRFIYKLFVEERVHLLKTDYDDDRSVQCPWCENSTIVCLQSHFYCMFEDEGKKRCGWDFPAICPFCKLTEIRPPTTNDLVFTCACKNGCHLADALIIDPLNPNQYLQIPKRVGLGSSW